MCDVSFLMGVPNATPIVQDRTNEHLVQVGETSNSGMDVKLARMYRTAAGAFISAKGTVDKSWSADFASRQIASSFWEVCDTGSSKFMVFTKSCWLGILNSQPSTTIQPALPFSFLLSTLV